MAVFLLSCVFIAAVALGECCGWIHVNRRID